MKNNFGYALSNLMNDKCITGVQLAKDVGLTQASVSRILNGTRPRKSTLYQIIGRLCENKEERKALFDAYQNTDSTPGSSKKEENKLVDAETLLEILFDERSRPSLRWIRILQKERKIPYYKMGHFVRFDVEQVREALRNNCTVGVQK